jgi:hypothetical protein
VGTSSETQTTITTILDLTTTFSEICGDSSVDAQIDELNWRFLSNSPHSGQFVVIFPAREPISLTFSPWKLAIQIGSLLLQLLDHCLVPSVLAILSCSSEFFLAATETID